MNMQVQTQQTTAQPTAYESKTGMRYSVVTFQPVSTSIEFSPAKNNSTAEMAKLFDEAIKNDLPVNLDFQNSIDNFGKPKMIVYCVTLPKPQQK